ncbi:ribonuclease H [Deinococcus koreensis]|uniref:Ribonuclease H n=1 Tax=Deinococcus koreensis TaxID=2054903 RepID=A0A2K3UZM1_9DEIO|nr:ribonuclease H [Deinococcus koreensis]PNY81996.1 ribonuclease H [Deinococcus koreensis]
MNHAFVDASWHELPDSSGVGGWGLVLITPGNLPSRFQGQLEAPDNNLAEVRAVLEAVRLAPPDETLHVYTDNEAVIAAVGRGRGPAMLHEAAREVMDEAQQRGVALRVGYAPRTRRHMLTAHDLANEARRGIRGLGLNGLGTNGLGASSLGASGLGALVERSDVLIEHRSGWTQARVSLRRSGERVTALIPLDLHSEVPPSAQALMAAVGLAQPGEALTVRRASRVAQALWQRPERALRSAAQSQLREARLVADSSGVQVEFLAS